MNKYSPFPLVLLGLMAFSTSRGADGVEAAACVATPGETEVRKHLSDTEYEITTIRLWSDQAPDEPRPIPAESVSEGRRGMRIENVTQPAIIVARPKNLTEPAPAMLVCPGGGYGSLGIEEGGVDIIHWIKPLDIVGVYLKYRVPKRNQGFAMYHQALQDIQRAVSLLRSRAQELCLDPDRIGVIGFSAGGNLAAMLATHHQAEDRLYKSSDPVDQISCRPDFVALVAPAYLTEPIVSDKLVPELKPERLARNITPPIFIASASTDKFTVGACYFSLLLREKHVSVELHVYEKGGHAEGIHEGPDNQWPTMFKDWLIRKGVIGKANAKP